MWLYEGWKKEREEGRREEWVYGRERKEFIRKHACVLSGGRRGAIVLILQQVLTIMSMDISNQSQVVRDGLAGLLRESRERKRDKTESARFFVRSFVRRLFFLLFVLRA